jgi:NAD-dependent SIR2 family protein deacetylase
MSDDSATVERLNVLCLHGWMGDKNWLAPRLTVKCNRDARPGYMSCKAHEYMDEPRVLTQKVALLAKMIKEAKNCIAYTGAGISTSAGIDDYATQAGDKSNIETGRVRLKTPWDAAPTLSHRVLAALHQHPCNYLKHWIQQNHDGLPQKAGFPQHALNEIHGAWYDPSNPVVRMSGSLRDDLFESLLHWEQTADLCLTLGTSLAGMNADRVAISTATRSREKDFGGTVIVGLQKTQHDHLSSLRIFATINTVMELLAEEMQLDVRDAETAETEQSVENKSRHVFHNLPYDTHSGGRLHNTDAAAAMTLDLRAGQSLRITSGPYEGSLGEVIGTNRQGHYKLRFMIELPTARSSSNSDGSSKPPRKPFKAPFELILGSWWPLEALYGAVDRLPVVNFDGEFKLERAMERMENVCTEQVMSKAQAHARETYGSTYSGGVGVDDGAPGFTITVGGRYVVDDALTVTVTNVADIAITFMHDTPDDQENGRTVKGRKWFLSHCSPAIVNKLSECE